MFCILWLFFPEQPALQTLRVKLKWIPLGHAVVSRSLCEDSSSMNCEQLCEGDL